MLDLEQAGYGAERARRQYDAVEPERASVSVEERAKSAVAKDLPQVWNHPSASTETRKRILRAVLEDIVVTVGSTHLQVKLHRKGGEHTLLEIPKTLHGQHRWKTSLATEQLIQELARLLPDGSIASVLSRLSVRSAKGHSWTQLRVRNFRAERGIAIYREAERAERGEMILHEAAGILGVSQMTVIRLIKDGLLPARQAFPGASYVIRKEDLDCTSVRSAIANGRAVSQDLRQECLVY